MSRSNYDKPFYVDVGTSVVAIRCASNHDVVEQYDYAWSPGTLKLAEDICDRMNKEAEIVKPLRNCDVGTAEEQAQRYDQFCEENECSMCPVHAKWRQHFDVCKHEHISCGLIWAQMTYEAEEGGAK